MAGINKWLGIGRLGRDPELRYTGSGTAVCSFSIAVDSSYTKDGEKHEAVEWINIVTWSKLAEVCGEYLKKGSQVYIEGRLQTSNYEKDGVKRYKTEIVAGTMQMLGTASDKQREEPTDKTSDGSDVPF